ncbi:hypothetical protein WN943_018435 [Citrus x changshan-huyou]
MVKLYIVGINGVRIGEITYGFFPKLQFDDNPLSSCPICRQTMTSEMTFVSQVAVTSTAAAVATERGLLKRWSLAW